MNTKLLYAGLIVSLVINLIAIGFFIGQYTNRMQVSMTASPSTFTGRLLLQPLAAERRIAIAQKMRSLDKDLRQSLASLRSTQREIVKSSIAEPFSEEDLQRAFDAFDERMVQTLRHQHTIHATILKELTPAERVQVMDSIMRVIQRSAQDRNRKSSRDISRPPRVRERDRPPPES